VHVSMKLLPRSSGNLLSLPPLQATEVSMANAATAAITMGPTRIPNLRPAAFIVVMFGTLVARSNPGAQNLFGRRPEGRENQASQHNGTSTALYCKSESLAHAREGR
jgi:hypothetical protein